METDNVNPEGGTVEDVARILLEKSEPKAPEETEEEAAEDLPEEDNSEPVDDEEGTEASEEEGDEPEDEDEDTDEETEQPKFTVKVDGKEIEVPLDELRAGYMKDQDYRKKTTEVAEERKLVEAEKAKVADAATVRENLLTELQTVAGVVETFVLTDEKLQEILRTKGAEAYLHAKASNDQIQQHIQTLRKREGEVKEELTAEQQKALDDRKKSEQQALFTALPDLADAKKQEALLKYIFDLGYKQEDYEATIDHRVLAAFEKARRYDEQIAKGKQKPVSKIPKVTKGDAPRQSGSELKGQKLKELSLKAKRSGSVDDLAALLMAKK